MAERKKARYSYVRRPTRQEIEDAIAEATSHSQRHIHAAQRPCEGCVEIAARAVERLLDRRDFPPED